MTEYGFTLSGFDLPGNTDPLGVCRVAPVGATTFAVGDAAADEPTWHVELPASAIDAQHILANNAALLQQQQESLSLIQQEFNSFTRQGGAGLVSFSATSAASEHFVAQKEMLRESLNYYVPDSDVDALTSYGLRDWFRKKKKPRATSAPPRSSADQSEWLAFVHQAERALTNYVRVETMIPAPTIAGATRVGWTGDFHTTWHPSMSATARQLHLQAVNVALTSRMSLVRLIAVVAGGAAGLAAKATALPPGGQVLLLPAAWRFVKDVLAELRKTWPQLQQLG